MKSWTYQGSCRQATLCRLHKGQTPLYCCSPGRLHPLQHLASSKLLHDCLNSSLQGLLECTDSTLYHTHPQRPTSERLPSTSSIRQHRHVSPGLAPAESRRPSSAPAQTRLAHVGLQQPHTAPARHYPAGLGQVSRDCSVNGSTSTDTRQKLHGPSTGSFECWLTGRSSPDSRVTAQQQLDEPQTMRSAAADWQAYYQHRAGVAACSSQGSIHAASSPNAVTGMKLQPREQCRSPQPGAHT